MRTLEMMWTPIVMVENGCDYMTVMGSAWLNRNEDRLGIIITNAGNVTETISFNVMPADFALPGTGNYTFKQITPSGNTKLKEFDGATGLSWSFTLGPLEVSLFEINQ